MSNVLGIPEPLTRSIDLCADVRSFLYEKFPDMDTQRFERDIDAWNRTREECIVTPSSSTSFLQDSSPLWQYTAQLTFLARVLGPSVRHYVGSSR